MAIFEIWIHHGSYWVNFRMMFYRLSNLGASPFRPTSDTEQWFLSILSNLCITHTCPRWWHPCWWRILETKYWWQFKDFGDQFDTSKTRSLKKSPTKRFCHQHLRSVNIINSSTSLSPSAIFQRSHQIGHQNLQIVANIRHHTEVTIADTCAWYTN